MLSEEKLRRIKELSQKKKAGDLTESEQVEREVLHQEYLQAFRQSMRQQLDHLKVIDPEGNDITPNK
ncbi:DUF896 domain-containing protein [Falseniella ignava]|uniref:UPF0291 protein HMPREF9707_00735 n=2 Tax=Falseniella ignava TaxID=137730 RepID=K1LR10_9LACT|nr:DUF896 domain-containing protein [Falseniella ignava]EKB57226.1 hypothetical protein HMPREF9707_00735 [Falseniella ignava CCUG 37419]PKY90284.1 DUF896 family protein [Falseniella ignava]